MKRQHPTDPNLFWCPRCKTYKAREEFFKKKTSKWGLAGMCKACASMANRKYRENNPEKKKEANRKYRENNLEKKKERNRKYRENNPEKVKERNRKYRENNPEKVKEANRKYRENNPEKAKERYRKYRENDLEKAKERGRKYAERLSEGYIKNRLKKGNLPVTPEFIKLKRQQITMIRRLKQFKQWRKENESNYTDV